MLSEKRQNMTGVKSLKCWSRIPDENAEERGSEADTCHGNWIKSETTYWWFKKCLIFQYTVLGLYYSSQDTECYLGGLDSHKYLLFRNHSF